MTTHHAIGEPIRLPDISRLDRARFVKEARRLRAAESTVCCWPSAAASPALAR